MCKKCDFIFNYSPLSLCSKVISGYLLLLYYTACSINSRLVIGEDDFPIYSSNCFQEIMHVNKVSFNSSMQVHELKLVCVGGGGGERSHFVSCDKSR